MDSFNAVVAKQEMNGDHETSIENATERFIVFFNRLDWFKSGTPCSLDENDQFLLLTSNLQFVLILASANWLQPKYSGTQQLNMFWHGDPNPEQKMIRSGCYSRFEFNDLMPKSGESHPLYEILKTVMEIDMDETIFLLLITITILNSKAIQMVKAQDHLKLKLFRYLKSKLPQSEAISQFRKMEEILYNVLNSRGFYELLQN